MSGANVGKPKIKVMDLKPNMNNVSLTARVIKVEQPKTINTRSGTRTISEVVIGDDSGKVKLTLWGKAIAGKVKEGDVVEIKNAWTTVFKGSVQLNVGGEGNIVEIQSNDIPDAASIPDNYPKVPEGFKPEFRNARRLRRPFRKSGSFRREQKNSEEEEDFGG